MRSLSLPLFYYVTINISTLDVILMMTLGKVFRIRYKIFIVPLLCIQFQIYYDLVKSHIHKSVPFHVRIKVYKCDRLCSYSSDEIIQNTFFFSALKPQSSVNIFPLVSCCISTYFLCFAGLCQNGNCPVKYCLTNKIDNGSKKYTIIIILRSICYCHITIDVKTNRITVTRNLQFLLGIIIIAKSENVKFLSNSIFMYDDIAQIFRNFVDD